MTRRTPPLRRSGRARRRLLTLLVVVAAAGLTGLVGACVPAAAPSTSSPPPGSSTAPPSAAATAARGLALLERARTVERRPEVSGYDRDCGPGEGCVFGTSWTDDSDAPDGHNGCDTRNDVLGTGLVEASFAPGTHGCKVVAGLLRDPYTGTEIDLATRGSQIHVDHLVPLAAAWDLGAAAWSPAERTAFANDTRLELVAVSESANLSKGDSTLAEWLPPREAVRCAYVVDYLTVLVHYDLALTRDDARTAREVLRTGCASGVTMRP